MTATVGAIIDKALAEESGEYTNNAHDAGGPTKWGITQATLSEYLGRPASILEVQELTRADAWSVLYDRYVKRPRFDQVVKIAPAVGAKLVDAGVNCGQPTVAMWLQRCLNAFSLCGTKYRDVAVDGAVGPGTLAALQAFLAWRGPEGAAVLLEALECLQGDHYIELAEKRPPDADFVYGWIKDRVGEAHAG